ncbi:MAG: hypothetical protein ACPGJV_15175 [Bacteriovoracaceae bacterium]
MKILFVLLFLISHYSSADEINCIGEVHQSTTANIENGIQASKNYLSERLEPSWGELKIIRGTEASGIDQKGYTIFSGVPKGAKIIESDGVVFRHYTKKKSEIVESNKLIAGPLSYIKLVGDHREVYDDLTGVFLTRTDAAPGRVGLGNQTEYEFVDIRLPEGTPVIELEEDIFLVPGNQGYHGWVLDVYKEYKETGKIKMPPYKQMVEDIERRGGILPALEIDVDIL